MNYGIQDAINLTWKLAWAKRYLLSSAINNTNTNEERSKNAIANNIIFDSYEAERRPFGEILLKNTKYGMYFASLKNPIFKFIRNMVFRMMVYFNVLPKAIANSISMLDLAYTHPSPILFTNTEHKNYYLCKSGERMPNLPTANGQLLYHCIDRTRHSFVTIHSSSCTNDNDKFILKDKGPGGLNLLHIKVSNNETSKSHAILIRPDLYVAAVGDTMSEIWEVIGKNIGIDARDCM